MQKSDGDSATLLCNIVPSDWTSTAYHYDKKNEIKKNNKENYEALTAL